MFRYRGVVRSSRSTSKDRKGRKEGMYLGSGVGFIRNVEMGSCGNVGQ